MNRAEKYASILVFSIMLFSTIFFSAVVLCDQYHYTYSAINTILVSITSDGKTQAQESIKITEFYPYRLNGNHYEATYLNSGRAVSSFNTSSVIQWAIDNQRGVIDFQKGGYNLTNTVMMGPLSNLELNGNGANFCTNRTALFTIKGGVYGLQIHDFFLAGDGPWGT
jgi:hypothetical protein